MYWGSGSVGSKVVGWVFVVLIVMLYAVYRIMFCDKGVLEGKG